jgi:hypothetical protein
VVVGGLENPSRTLIVKPTKREAGLRDGEEQTFTSMSTITHPSKRGEACFTKDRQLNVQLWKPKQPGLLCLISMTSYAWLLVLRPCEWDCIVKLLPLPQPPVRARTDARTIPSAQRSTQLRSVLARVYDVSIQNQITTTVP